MCSYRGYQSLRLADKIISVYVTKNKFQPAPAYSFELFHGIGEKPPYLRVAFLFFLSIDIWLLLATIDPSEKSR